MIVSSFSYDKGARPQADLVVDCRRLANPHQVPGLRPRDGTQDAVRDWLLAQPGTVELIDEVHEDARRTAAASIAVGCSAGRHRSVVVADELASRFEVSARHIALEAKKARKRASSTTDRGLGWRHQQQRERLLRAHRDGTPCWWCGEPMYRSQALDADHEEARATGGTRATRLLHASCNRSRKDGARDADRPAVATRSQSPARAPVFDWGE